MSLGGIFHPRVLATLGLGAIVAVATAGFAAANTVPASQASDGAGAVSGYTVSVVHYNLNATNPGLIDSFTFTAVPAPPAGSTIRAKLVAASSTWISCTDAGNDGVDVTCVDGVTTTLAADNLRVVIGS